VVQNWLQIPILFSLEHAVVGLGVDNLTQVFIQDLMHEGGLTKDLIGKKLMTFNASGVSIFHSIKSGVIWQIFDVWPPHSRGSLHGSQSIS